MTTLSTEQSPGTLDHGSAQPGPSETLPNASSGFCELSSTGIIRVSGPDAGAFLQGQFTNDVLALDVGSSQYSAWCSPKGRMLANFVVARVDASTYELILDASLVPAIRKRLAMFVLRSKVVIEDVTEAHALFGVGGAEAKTALSRMTDASTAPALHRLEAIDGGHVLALPGDRFLIVADVSRANALRQRLEDGLRTITLNQWQWMTLTSGVPVITAATSDLFVPQTANWDVLAGVNFQKGCYAGQEIVARTQYLGRLKERLFLLHTEADGIAAGDRLYSAAFTDQPSGTVVNAAMAPGGGVDMLAVLQLASAASGDLHAGSVDGPVAHLLSLPYPIPEPVAPRGRIV